MSYFELFDLKPALQLDESALKKLYFRKSKDVHPDFYTLDSDEAQEAMLEASTLLNSAYKVLSDFDTRLHYVLREQGVLAEEGQNKLPESFLMEMMDINEALMELEFDFDKEQYESALATLGEVEDSLWSSIQSCLDKNDLDKLADSDWEVLKNFHLKKRYLLRIRENLRKFASAS